MRILTILLWLVSCGNTPVEKTIDAGKPCVECDGSVDGEPPWNSSELPVVIVAGTTSPELANKAMAARLERAGFDVSIYVLPELGLGPLGETANDFALFMEDFFETTDSPKVHLIGHSQGGLIARDYMKNYGGWAKVDLSISLGAPHYGTRAANACPFLDYCSDMQEGSDYLNELNEGPDVLPPSRAVSIRTAFDTLVVPHRNSMLEDGAINIRLQDECPLRVVGHAALIVDGAVASGVKRALLGETVRFDCFAL